MYCNIVAVPILIEILVAVSILMAIIELIAILISILELIEILISIIELIAILIAIIELIAIIIVILELIAIIIAILELIAMIIAILIEFFIAIYCNCNILRPTSTTVYVDKMRITSTIILYWYHHFHLCQNLVVNILFRNSLMPPSSGIYP